MESNGSLPPGDDCTLTACTPGSAPGPMLGNEYGRTLLYLSHDDDDDDDDADYGFIHTCSEDTHVAMCP